MYSLSSTQTEKAQFYHVYTTPLYSKKEKLSWQIHAFITKFQKHTSTITIYNTYNGSKSNKQVGVYIVAFIVYRRYVGCRYLETTMSPFENESVGEYKSSET